MLRVMAGYKSCFCTKSLITLCKEARRKPVTHKDIDGARVAMVELSNVGVLTVGVTSLVLFEGTGGIPKLATLEGSPVPTTTLIETDLVRLNLWLGMGDTMIVEVIFDGRT